MPQLTEDQKRQMDEEAAEMASAYLNDEDDDDDDSFDDGDDGDNGVGGA